MREVPLRCTIRLWDTYQVSMFLNLHNSGNVFCTCQYLSQWFFLNPLLQCHLRITIRGRTFSDHCCLEPFNVFGLLALQSQAHDVTIVYSTKMSSHSKLILIFPPVSSEKQNIETMPSISSEFQAFYCPSASLFNPISAFNLQFSAFVLCHVFYFTVCPDKTLYVVDLLLR